MSRALTYECVWVSSIIPKTLERVLSFRPFPTQIRLNPNFSLLKQTIHVLFGFKQFLPPCYHQSKNQSCSVIRNKNFTWRSVIGWKEQNNTILTPSHVNFSPEVGKFFIDWCTRILVALLNCLRIVNSFFVVNFSWYYFYLNLRDIIFWTF